MDGNESTKSAADGAPGAVSAMCLDASCEHESTQLAKKQYKRKSASTELDIEPASAEWQREIDALYESYKEVSGHHLDPKELACTGDSSIACLLEESSLPCSKLTDEIYNRMKLQDDVTKSSIRNSVLNIGKRSSYGISAVDVDELEDESESSLWCWEVQDLALLPSHLHSYLSTRRKARKLIQERILVLSGKQSANDGPDAGSSKNCHSGNAGSTEMQSKTTAPELQAVGKPMKDQQMINSQVQKEQKKKDRELKRVKENAEKEARRMERESKRLKKHQEEADRAKKRQEKEEAELKRKASIQKQKKIMESFLKRKTNSNVESPGSHHLLKTKHPKSSENIEELAVAATSAMDYTLSEPNYLRVEEFWLAHVTRWRKLSRHKRFHHWGVRRSPKIQLFHELKLKRSSATGPLENMSTPTKGQLSQESSGSIDFTNLLDELKTPSYASSIPSKSAQNSTPSSVELVKKLLQFDRSSRPAYYGTWRKKSCTVNARKPFKKDLELNYEVESDEEWDEEDPGERLSDFEEDDEETMDEHDSKVDAEDEAENSFIVPNDYLSEDEGVQYEPLSGRFYETCMLSTPGVTVEELNILLESQKHLHNFTKHALMKERPLIITNLDHSKHDLLKAVDINGIQKVEKLCLQALCMKKYPGGPIIDVPVIVNASIEDSELCRSSKNSPRTPVPSKSISDSDMPEFVKLTASCSQGMSKLVELLHGKFPCVSKVQLKNKVREIAEYTNNRWQVRKAILDQYSLYLSPDETLRGSALHLP